MQKIKSVLNPGYKKDEEIIYGVGKGNQLENANQAKFRKRSNNGGGSPQILNPDGGKHIEPQNNAPGTKSNNMSSPPATDSRPDNSRQQLGTYPGQKEHGVMRHIMNPGGYKADSMAYGKAAFVGSTTETPSGDHPACLPNIPATGGRFMETPIETANIELGESERGLQAPGGATDGGLPGQTSRTLNSAVAVPNSQNNCSRDAALAGEGSATAGGLYELNKCKDAVQPATFTPKHTSQILITDTTNAYTPSHASDPAKVAASASDPKYAGTRPQRGGHVVARDAATAGGSGMAVAGSLKRHEEADPGYAFDDPSPDSSRALHLRVDAVTRKIPGAWPRGDSYSSEIKQPSNDLNPVAEEQEHHLRRDASIAGGTGAGAIAFEASEAENHHEVENVPAIPKAATSLTGQPEEARQHYGRDAAVAGVAVVGACEAEESHKEPEKYGTAAAKLIAIAQTAREDHHYGRDGAMVEGAGVAGGAEELQPAATTELAIRTALIQAVQATQREHHYGQDAALAGGAGAAGLTADHVDKRHDTIEIPSSTQRTTPETETASNYSWPDPDDLASTGREHHYGYDAALFGGAGAALFIGADEIAKKKQVYDFIDPVSSAAHLQVQRDLLGGYDGQRAVLGHHMTNAPAAGGAGADTECRENPPDWVRDHHLERDTAMAGGVTSLLGAGALYKGEKQHDATAAAPTTSLPKSVTVAAQQPGNGPEYEYAKTYRGNEHDRGKQSLTPERPHGRKDRREHKGGGLLAKILHRKGKSVLQDDSIIADDEASSPISPKRSLASARRAEETAADVCTRAVGADELKGHSSEQKKHLGEFAHLGRNKLHKDPPPKRYQQCHVAGPSGSNSPPTRSSTVVSRNYVVADELMGDPHAGSGSADCPIPMDEGEEEYRSVIAEPQTVLPMNAENEGTGVVGTDGSATIEGYGQWEGFEPDWHKVGGMNTLY